MINSGATEAGPTPGPNGDSPETIAPSRRSESEQLLDDLIFRQDLNEVHLLIDFISGRADRSWSTLTMPNPVKDQQGAESSATGDQDTKGTLNAGDIVMRLAKMRYPPKDDPVANAKNAAILLMAKDRLSVLAAPARSLTIAYTTMFIGADRSRWSDRTHSGNARSKDTKKPPNESPLPRDSRTGLALQIFPALERHARQFRFWRNGLMWFSILWAVLTAVAYWDAALGRSVLERLNHFWTARKELLEAMPELSDDAVCRQDEAQQKDAPTIPANADAKTAAKCRTLRNLDASREQANTDLRRIFGCTGMSKAAKAVHVWCWSGLLSGRLTQLDPANDRGDTIIEPASQRPAIPADSRNVTWQSAASILSVFSTYILPMMFALLGTLIGTFRAILKKVRDSTLAPRDLVLMWLGIPMGLVAGIAVGLFFSPSGAPFQVQGSATAASTVSLTPSGLGFLAGYGAQAFFRFMDHLLGQVFPENQSPAPSPSDTAGHNA